MGDSKYELFSSHFVSFCTFKNRPQILVDTTLSPGTGVTTDSGDLSRFNLNGQFLVSCVLNSTAPKCSVAMLGRRYLAVIVG